MATDEQRALWVLEAAALDAQMQSEKWHELTREIFPDTREIKMTMGQRVVLEREFNKRYAPPGMEYRFSWNAC